MCEIFVQGTSVKGRGCQPELHVKIAQCCTDLSLYSDALAELEAIEKPARTLKVHNSMARLYRRLGKKTAAIAAYQVPSFTLHNIHADLRANRSDAWSSGRLDFQTQWCSNSGQIKVLLVLLCRTAYVCVPMLSRHCKH